MVESGEVGECGDAGCDWSGIHWSCDSKNRPRTALVSFQQLLNSAFESMGIGILYFELEIHPVSRNIAAISCAGALSD